MVEKKKRGRKGERKEKNLGKNPTQVKTKQKANTKQNPGPATLQKMKREGVKNSE